DGRGSPKAAKRPHRRARRRSRDLPGRRASGAQTEKHDRPGGSLHHRPVVCSYGLRVTEALNGAPGSAGELLALVVGGGHRSRRAPGLRGRGSSGLLTTLASAALRAALLGALGSTLLGAALLSAALLRTTLLRGTLLGAALLGAALLRRALLRATAL